MCATVTLLAVLRNPESVQDTKAFFCFLASCITFTVDDIHLLLLFGGPYIILLHKFRKGGRAWIIFLFRKSQRNGAYLKGAYKSSARMNVYPALYTLVVCG